jgi:hypothetical protein
MKEKSISSYVCFLREMLREMVDQMSIHQEVGGPDINIPPFQRFVPDPPSRMYSRMFRYQVQLFFSVLDLVPDLDPKFLCKNCKSVQIPH